MHKNKVVILYMLRIAGSLLNTLCVKKVKNERRMTENDNKDLPSVVRYRQTQMTENKRKTP